MNQHTNKTKKVSTARSYDFKKAVLTALITEDLTLKQTAAKFDVPFTSIHYWLYGTTLGKGLMLKFKYKNKRVHNQ